MTTSSEYETKIAISKMRLKNRIHAEILITKEASDIPNEATHVVYAVFEILAEIAQGTGREHEWHQFLLQSLSETIVNYKA